MFTFKKENGWMRIINQLLKNFHKVKLQYKLSIQRKLKKKNENQKKNLIMIINLPILKFKIINKRVLKSLKKMKMSIDKKILKLYNLICKNYLIIK
jgi:hypothetical protein